MFAQRKDRLLIGFVLLLGLALGVGLALRGAMAPLPVRLALSVAFAVPAIWGVLVYWRSIDEAAQAAQKFAWFWGGSFGMGAGLLLLMPPVYGRLGLASHAEPAFLPLLGGCVVATAALVGFFIAWAGWWLARR